MSEQWRNGSTRAWRKLREFVLAENRRLHGGQCRARCLGRCTGVATEAHHTKGRAVTGDDPAHIAAVCKPCNLHIGDPATHDPRCPLCVNVAWSRGGNPPVTAVTQW